MIDQEDVNKLRRLMEARQKRDAAEVDFENAKKDYREIEAELHEALTSGPMDRLNNVDLGPPWGKVSFHAKTTTYGRIVDEEKAHDYFEERAMLDDVSKPKFVKQRVNEIVRELDESDQPMPPGVDYYKRRYIQVTQQKSG